MLLYYLLFLVYSIACCWLINRSGFVKRSGLSTREVSLLFLIKVMAGVAIGWASLHLYGNGNDYWDVNREAWTEYQLLMHDPGEYFHNFFRSGYEQGYGGLFSSFDSFWNDMKNNVVIKIVSVFNLFSRGNYYINSLFFNSLIFFGHVALYRLFSGFYPGRKWVLIAGCFLLPSFLYFSSGIHKDGIVFISLATIMYVVVRAAQDKRLGWKRVLALVLAMIFLFLARNFVLFALLPALLGWWLCSVTRWPAGITMAGIYVLTIVLLFTLHLFVPAIDPVQLILQKQSDFAQLPVSSTYLPPAALEPTFTSFARNAPQALNHALIRPYVTGKPLSLLPFALEMLGYGLLLLLFIFFRRKEVITREYAFFLWGTGCFCLLLFLFMGYVVPNTGSMVRYRSLYLPLLVTPLLAGLDWRKFKREK